MAKVRVAILGTVGKAVFLDPDATNGATIGLNLRLPDGSVPSLERLAEIICSYCDTPVAPVTNIWKYLLEIPDNLKQLAALDCCGIIVRDCSVVGEGGEWEYSNFQMTELGMYSMTPFVGINSQSPFMEPANWQTFEAGTDNLIRVVENNNNLFEDSVMRIRVLDNTMSVVSESTVTHQGGFPSNPTFVYAADFVTGKFFTYNGNSGFYTQMGSGGAWEGNYAPTADAATGWQFAPQAWRLSGDQFARGGAWFVRLPKGGSPTEVNWNRIVKWTGANTASRTLPIASLLDVDGADPSNYAFYVNIDGTKVYVISENTWLMKEYDGNLVFVQDHDMSFAKETASEPTAFAVLGDFFFVQQPTRKMQVWQISTQTKVGDYQFSADEPGVSSPAKILPHPSGLVFVQRTPNTNSLDLAPSEVYSFRWADATFVPPPAVPLWTCIEIVSGDAYINVVDGDGQGGDPTITLNDLPISKITGLQDALDAKEDGLGNPAEDGYVLSSTAAGVRSWVEGGGGGILPMTTGEVPPVFVYGPDGSLIYFEV